MMRLLHTLHHSHRLSYGRLMLCLLSAGLLLIAAACSASGETGNGGSTPAPSPTKVTATATSTPTPPATIPNCPALGTALAASMPSLQTGTRANIVYFRNQSNPDGSPAAVFYRYDVQTASATVITVEKQVIVLDAQLSRDGQWILFTAQFGHQTMFQLVRIDGEQLQTLYCATPGTRIITQGSRGTTSPTQW